MYMTNNLPQMSGEASLLRNTIAVVLAVLCVVLGASTAAAIPPLVTSPMPDTTVAEDSTPIDNYRDLNGVFSDAEDGGALDFAVFSNSNPALVSATIDADSALDLSFAAQLSGSATLVIRATDTELFSVDDTLVVTVTAVNDTPTVAVAVPDTTVLENAAPVDNYRDLNAVFDDVEDGSALTFSVQSNSNPGLVNVTIDPDSALDISVAPNNEGNATIVIRATDSGGAWRDETFVVGVHRTLWHIQADGSGQRATIQAAIDATVDGDTILLYDGTYTGSSNRNLIFSGKAIHLTSVGGPASTIIDLQGANRGADLVNGEGPGTVISGVTFRNGNAVNGAGLHIAGASPTITNVVIEACSGSDGGGMRIDNGSPAITDCVIVGNTASWGGGIYLNDASPTITNCTIVENGAPNGGGQMHIRNASNPTITNTIVAFGTQGPGVQCAGGNPTFACSDIFGNAGGDTLCGIDGGGNFSADPIFCGAPGSGDVTISESSPCAPANNSCGVLVGAAGVACGPPMVVAALPDTTVELGIGTIDDYADLNDVFWDSDDGSALSFSVEGNTNPEMLTAVIDADSALDFIFDPTVGGIAALVIRATDSDSLFAETSMTVNVIGGTVTFLAPGMGGSALRPGDVAEPIYTLTIVSSSAVPETLTAVTFTSTATGPGTQTELDNDFSPLSLRSQDGSAILPGGAPGSATGTLASGRVTFSNLEVVVAPGDWLSLVVEGAASMVARDGDVLALALDDSTDVTMTPLVDLAGQWPLASGDGFPVDGMVAAQLTLHQVDTPTFSAGTVRNLALDVTLPPNGYDSDTLNRLNVVNLGTAAPATDIAAMEAWADDGDAVFDPAFDTLLGGFSHTGTRWEVTGLSAPVPPGGLRVFVSVDVGDLATAGRTVRLGLPSSPDVGVGMDSGNDGPLDVAVEQPVSHSIVSSTSVVLTATPIAPAPVSPGASDVVLLHVVATNNYVVDKQMSQLRVANATLPSGPATQADADSDFESVVLRVDGNDNGVLDDRATDPVVGNSLFSTGVATFSGLSWSIPAGGSRHLFVTGDVSFVNARDGDALAASIPGVFDVDFTDATVVVAGWPVTSGAAWTVDGMLAAQITNFGGPSATLAPNDGPFLALDLLVPSNGYADDVLDGLEVVNLGTATQADLSEMKLWSDGGDGQFTPGSGDDTELAPLVWTSGAWTSPLLGESIPAGGRRFFVGVTVAPSPTDSASVRLAVPVDGIAMASDNDGPIDATVEHPQTLLLSTAPLLITMDVEPPASTIGQNVTVRMLVRNVGGEQVNTVIPSALTMSGDATLVSASGPQPVSLTLAVGQVDTLTWTFTAQSSGSVRWSGWCEGTGDVSGLSRSALPTESGEHRVFAQAGSLALFPIETMPFQVSRGQVDVVPLSLTLTATGGANASDARVLGLKLRLEDSAGAGIIPADLLSKVTVGEGSATYVSRTSLETSGAEIDLTFATPALVRALEQATIAIRMDIKPTTVVPEFRIVIVDSTWVAAEDAISGAPVSVVLDQPPFPIQTGLGRLTVSATDLEVDAVAGAAQRAGRGQTNLEVMTLSLNNPGIDGLTADADVASFDVVLTDTNGTPVPAPWTVFDRIRVEGSGGALAAQTWEEDDTTSLSLSLSPLADVPVNSPVELTLHADVAAAAPAGAYRLRLGDASQVDARDSNTGAPLAVVYGSPVLEGNDVAVEITADTLMAGGVPGFPPTINVGQSDVTAITATLRHPGAAGVARVLVDGVTLRFQNAQREPVVPGSVVGRVRLLVNTAEVADVTSVPNSGNSVPIVFPGVELDPGETADVTVVVDFAASAPQSFVEIVIDAANISVVDGNLGSAVTVAAETGASMPLTSGLTQLLPPATELEVSLVDDMPAVLTAGSLDLRVCRLTLANTAAAGSGRIDVDHLILRAANADLAPIAIGRALASVQLYSAGVPLAASATLNEDSVTAWIAIAPALQLEPGQPLELDVRVDVSASPDVASLRVGIDEDGVGVVQPASALLQVNVIPPAGETFPLWTQAGNFTALTLSESFSNFPNPFAAGKAPTTFVYYLARDAEVTLKIYTVRGEEVRTIRGGERRAAGLYQDDVWNGRNGRGVTVYNGVYVAELVVKFDDGASERLLRKVAVVR